MTTEVRSAGAAALHITDSTEDARQALGNLVDKIQTLVPEGKTSRACIDGTEYRLLIGDGEEVILEQRSTRNRKEPYYFGAELGYPPETPWESQPLGLKDLPPTLFKETKYILERILTAVTISKAAVERANRQVVDTATDL